MVGEVDLILGRAVDEREFEERVFAIYARAKNEEEVALGFEEMARTLELARGQYPLVTVLGCSDSRVSPSLVFDQTVGDLFEVRAAGNVADAVALGSIEYAVQDLRTPMLLVLGHDQCGAVVAAVSGEAMPSQGLQALVKRIAPAVERVRGQATGEALVALAVEANVQQSARDLLSESAILRRHVEGRQLTVVTALYRLATGDVVRLA